MAVAHSACKIAISSSHHKISQATNDKTTAVLIELIESICNKGSNTHSRLKSYCCSLLRGKKTVMSSSSLLWIGQRAPHSVSRRLLLASSPTIRSKNTASSFVRHVSSPIHTRMSPQIRYLSSNTFKPFRFTGTAEPETNNIHKQPFVETQIHPGEWDPDMTNPLYRPKWRSTARVLSPEDFEQRPRVRFENQSKFANSAQAMIAPSWMPHSTYRVIYKTYHALMEHSQQAHGVASHEYIIRVLAQKFNINFERAAAIVTLGHEEERWKAEGIPLNEEEADYMDLVMTAEVKEMYEASHLRAPEEFVESPAEYPQGHRTYMEIADVYNVDKLMDEMVVRDAENARLIINNHEYVEDKPEEDVPLPISNDCRKLLKSHERFKLVGQKLNADPPNPSARKRWKYVAQIINVREATRDADAPQHKKKRRRGKKYRDGKREVEIPATLVEEAGVLQGANKGHIQQTSWKLPEYKVARPYHLVREAWMRKIYENEEGGWGMAPVEETTETSRPPLSVQAVLEGAKDAIAAATKEIEEKLEKGAVVKDDDVGDHEVDEEDFLDRDDLDESDRPEIARDDSKYDK
jgi:hypothetical protein